MSASASAISEFFALALMSLKKSCALARAHHMTSARSERRSKERRSPKLCGKGTEKELGFFLSGRFLGNPAGSRKDSCSS